MKKNRKASNNEKKTKSRECVYAELGMALSEMYLKLEQEKTNQFMEEYSAKLEEKQEYVQECYQTIDSIGHGKSQESMKSSMSQLYSDYERIRKDADSKFKLYVRGMGNAGKSTLVNTLLQVEETQESKTSQIPKTVLIESYSDSIPFGKALVYRVGDAQGRIMSREEAKELLQKERDRFLQSNLECKEKIGDILRKVYDKEEQEERIRLIYEDLDKTTIRQIVWGMEESQFLKNCILSDTPGMLQEIPYICQWENVKNYEADGILWVFNQKDIMEKEMLDSYRQELGRFSRFHKIGYRIAVINVHSEEDTPGDDNWNYMQKETEKRLREYGIWEKFQHICYVNCKKAYEGKRKESNIEELCGIINTRLLEKRSSDVIGDKIRKYQDYMNTLKENLEGSVEKISDFERKYKERTERITQSLEDLKNEFINALNSAEEKQEREIIKGLEEREEEMIAFLEWNKEKQSSVLQQLARQEEINGIFYEIYRQQMEKINGETVRLLKESIVSRYDKIGAEVYLKAHKIQKKIISVAEISSFPKTSFWGGFLEELITGAGAVVGFFRGEDAQKRFIYKANIKPKIQKALVHSLNKLADDYKTQMKEVMEALYTYCTEYRDESFSHELGEKETVSQMKERLQELSKQKTEFVYREKNLKQLLFETESMLEES